MSVDLQNQLESIIDELPPLSPSVSKILELANDPTSSPKDLLDIIKIDPILTGKILKLINSAFYALPNQVTSLNKALILLGFNTIKNLALSTAILDSMKGDGGDAEELSALWDHCLSTAVGTKLLARAAGISRTELEEYFIAGLLHDIGRVVIAQHIPSEYKSIKEKQSDNSSSMSDCELEALGMTHSQIGLVIANKWQLPESLKEAIEKHHEESDSMVVNLVHIANQLCKEKNLGLDIDGIHKIRPSAVKSCNLNKAKIIEAFSSIEAEVEKAQILLSA